MLHIHYGTFFTHGPTFPSWYTFYHGNTSQFWSLYHGNTFYHGILPVYGHFPSWYTFIMVQFLHLVTFIMVHFYHGHTFQLGTHSSWAHFLNIVNSHTNKMIVLLALFFN